MSRTHSVSFTSCCVQLLLINTMILLLVGLAASLEMVRSDPTSVSLGGFGGGDFGGYGGGLESGLTHADLSLGGGGGGSYSGHSSYEAESASGESQGKGGDGGDFHHGVSIVGAGGGGEGHTASFDLTHHGGGGHSGPFGGSFVASAKYEGQGGIAHSQHLPPISFGHAHYSDVLGASEDGASLEGGSSLGGGGGDGGGYKWGYVPPSQSHY